MRPWWTVLWTPMLFCASLASAAGTESPGSTTREATPSQAGQVAADQVEPIPGPGDEALLILSQSSLSLTDLYRLAELGNHDLASTRAEVAAMAGRTRQAGAYPNPTIGYEFEDAATGDFGSRADKVSISQSVIVSGRLGASRDAASASAEGVAHHLEAIRRDVFRNVHQLWADLLYTREAEATLQGTLDQARRTLEGARTRFEAQAAPESHVTKALVEFHAVESKKRHLSALRLGVIAELDNVVGPFQVSCDRVVGSLTEPSIDLDDLDSPASVQSNPGIRAARSRVRAAREQLRVARASRVPDLDLSLAYGVSRSSGEDFWEAGAAIPLPLFDRKQGELEEANALVKRAEEQLRAAERKLRTELTALKAQYDALAAEVDLLVSSMVPAASRALSQAGQGYLAGRMSLLDLIDAQRTDADARMRFLELSRELRHTEAQLANLAGFETMSRLGEER